MINEKMLELLCIKFLTTFSYSFEDKLSPTHLALLDRERELEDEFIKYIKEGYKRKG